MIIDEEITEMAIPTKPDVKLYFDISYSKLKCDIILKYKDKERLTSVRWKFFFFFEVIISYFFP